MITEAGMYWLTRLDAIRDLLALGFVLSGVFAAATIVIGAVDLTVGEKSSSKLFVIAWLNLLLLVAMGTVRTFIPSTKEMCAIVVVPKIANNEKLEQFGDKAYNLAIEWMDELKPNKKAGAGRMENGK